MQLTICIRYLLYLADRTNANCITRLIKDVLIHSSLMLNHFRGQCYDWVSNAVREMIRSSDSNPAGRTKAVYLHCMGHSLNLAVQDTCCSLKVMSDTFDTALLRK